MGVTRGDHSAHLITTLLLRLLSNLGTLPPGKGSLLPAQPADHGSLLTWRVVMPSSCPTRICPPRSMATLGSSTCMKPPVSSVMSTCQSEPSR